MRREVFDFVIFRKPACKTIILECLNKDQVWYCDISEVCLQDYCFGVSLQRPRVSFMSQAEAPPRVVELKFCAMVWVEVAKFKLKLCAMAWVENKKRKRSEVQVSVLFLIAVTMTPLSQIESKWKVTAVFCASRGPLARSTEVKCSECPGSRSITATGRNSFGSLDQLSRMFLENLSKVQGSPIDQTIYTLKWYPLGPGRRIYLERGNACWS
jgi:hypothetical protein